MRRFSILLGLLLLAGCAASKSPLPANAFVPGDVAGKAFHYSDSELSGGFRFRQKHQVVADVDVTGGGTMNLLCHWKIIAGHLELYEQEEKFWSFALVQRKPDGFVVEEPNGKRLELKAVP